MRLRRILSPASYGGTGDRPPEGRLRKEGLTGVASRHFFIARSASERSERLQQIRARSAHLLKVSCLAVSSSHVLRANAALPPPRHPELVSGSLLSDCSLPIFGHGWLCCAQRERAQRAIKTKCRAAHILKPSAVSCQPSAVDPPKRHIS